MSVKTKTIFLKSVLLAGLALGSTNVFAADIAVGSTVPGTIDPCQDLYLVNDPNNPAEDPNDGGVCVDVPVQLKTVKVVFNLDNPLVDTINGDKGPPFDHNSIGLRHMVMLATAMKHRIEEGTLRPENVSIVGLFHGTSMKMKWAFKGSPEAFWLNKLFALANPTDGSPAVNIQLEACGVTIKGMQQKGATLANGQPLDERAVYPGILVNQGAIGRLIDLEQHGYVYVQEAGGVNE